MAAKFNAVGARKDDIARAFSYIQATNPAVLEIGCGNGRDAAEIIKFTPDYLGIDYSQGMLDIARRDLPKARFDLVDVETFDFPPALDAIFAFASLLHSNKENLKVILGKAFVALKSGGVFFISLKKAPYQEELVEEELGIRTFYYYEPQDIRSLAGSQFNVVYEKVQTIRRQDWLEMILQK